MPLASFLAALARKVTMLYARGVEYVAWVTGYATGIVTRTKEADHLSMATSSLEDGYSEGAYVTDSTFDVTDYSTLKVDWERTGADGTANARLVVATTKNDGGATGSVASVSKVDATFARTVSSVDVSALSSAYYIRAHGSYVNSGSGELTSTLKVYRVWLE